MEIRVGPYESKLIAPRNVIRAVRERMKVRVDGYQYTDAYGRGWDGYKYFMTGTGTFKSGFVDSVLNILQSYEVEVVTHSDPLEVEELDTAVGNGWTLTPDQEDAVRDIMNHKYRNGTPSTHGVIDAAVGSGKTSIFASLIRNFPDKDFIILVNSTDLFRQTIRFFFDIYGEDEIGIIQGPTIRLRRITVAMVQTLSRRINKEISEYFDVLIADESHNLGNKTGEKVLSKLKCSYRYFFSGTAYDKDKKIDQVMLVGMCGPRIVRITNKQNQEKGITLEADVYMHEIDYPVLAKSTDYSEYLKVHPVRNTKIAQIVKSRPNQKILIVCKFIEHCENLLEYLPNNIYYTHGQDPDRHSVIDKYTKDPSGVLLTTFIIKEGINIPDIQVLISCFGGQDEVSTKQVAGRAIRNDGVLDKVEIHDFYDKGGLEHHSKKRIEYYKSEGYTIKYD
ncbi:MAG TPA: DEAD/DEAH box helicase family protein [Tissierellaceae bacterium]|nr:DEAD/DEAH box helicase family protein [Tissierellaceae bacterium]